MAQAETNNTPSSPRVDTSAAAYRSFLMEGDVADLAQMAKIAELVLHDVIGQTDFDGCQVVRHDLTPEGVARAIFAVSHVAALIEAFAEKHFGASAARTEH